MTIIPIYQFGMALGTTLDTVFAANIALICPLLFCDDWKLSLPCRRLCPQFCVSEIHCFMAVVAVMVLVAVASAMAAIT
jgi:hypothetical protein